MAMRWIAWWDAHPWLYPVALAVAGLIMFLTTPLGENSMSWDAWFWLIVLGGLVFLALVSWACRWEVFGGFRVSPHPDDEVIN